MRLAMLAAWALLLVLALIPLLRRYRLPGATGRVVRTATVAPEVDVPVRRLAVEALHFDRERRGRFGHGVIAAAGIAQRYAAQRGTE